MNWLRLLVLFENQIVAGILRHPGFHRVIGKIQRTVDDFRYGRSPHEPLRPGEATEEPRGERNKGFLKHFVEELRNQAKGTPSKVDEEGYRRK